MHLTLTEAAARAKMPSEDLLRCIENDELMAERTSTDAPYRISEEDLEAFLSKRSFEKFWENNDEEENLPAEKQSSSQYGNLRRVLTAEVVADLKIEHQVLMSRVETLERLFSEFMDLEKTEKTLVLEDSWKLKPTLTQDKSATNDSDHSLSTEQSNDSSSSSEAMLPKDLDEDFSSEAIMAEQVVDTTDAISMDVAEVQMETDSPASQSKLEKTATDKTLEPVAKKDVPKPELLQEKPKSAKDLLARKLKNASTERRDGEESQSQVPAREKLQVDIESDSPIAARLAEYERRLAEAKQTAIQIWH